LTLTPVRVCQRCNSGKLIVSRVVVAVQGAPPPHPFSYLLPQPPLVPAPSLALLESYYFIPTIPSIELLFTLPPQYLGPSRYNLSASGFQRPPRLCWLTTIETSLSFPRCSSSFPQAESQSQSGSFCGFTCSAPFVLTIALVSYGRYPKNTSRRALFSCRRPGGDVSLDHLDVFVTEALKNKPLTLLYPTSTFHLLCLQPLLQVQIDTRE
jgi:hypothetical protein